MQNVMQGQAQLFRLGRGGGADQKLEKFQKFTCKKTGSFREAFLSMTSQNIQWISQPFCLCCPIEQYCAAVDKYPLNRADLNF